MTFNQSSSTIRVNHTEITGNSNKIYGNHNVVTGRCNKVYGNHNEIIGDSNDATGDHNTLDGIGNSYHGCNNFCHQPPIIVNTASNTASNTLRNACHRRTIVYDSDDSDDSWGEVVGDGKYEGMR